MNEKLIQSVRAAENPTVKADIVSFYLSDCLREKKITIYEAYLLQWEVICYTRDGYVLPAWHGRVRIATCVQILNQKLLALLFQDMDCAAQSEKWGEEAYHMCAEKREHYIMDRYMEFLTLGCHDEDLLRTLLWVRENYALTNEDDGPYHNELFPYHFFETEKILLREKDFTVDKNISENMENLLIALNL